MANARRMKTSRVSSPYRRYALIGGIAGIALTIISVILFDLPLYLAWIIGLSICTFGLYWFDKRQAVAGGGRVPELVLHGMSLAGGFLGGWIGRSMLRHKTRHTSFLVVLVLATLLHLALLWWLL